ncbi:MAG TPA: aldo/keto reductase [Vicinamibacteria bacterium]|nr:aldo/keto reductase [Vicinamibacteria bacterium]
MKLTTEIPLLGLGTWDLRGSECVRTVAEALELGYRHIDTAQMYENEREIGRAIQDSPVDRDAVFVTTKLWRDSLTRAAVHRSVEESLRRLATDYVDLLLIHWPNDDVPLAETIEAMEGLREDGKTRAIGVSNFPEALWKQALDLAPVRVNQIEYHPFLDQTALLRFARERSLRLTAYRPIAKGRVAGNSTILRIARTYERTPVQVTLRWLVQQGVAAIPKAARRTHLVENLGIFDFVLTDEAMSAIDAVRRDQRYVNPGWAPSWD